MEKNDEEYLRSWQPTKHNMDEELENFLFSKKTPIEKPVKQLVENILERQLTHSELHASFNLLTNFLCAEKKKLEMDETQ